MNGRFSRWPHGRRELSQWKSGRDGMQADRHGSLAKSVGGDAVAPFLDPDGQMVESVDVIGAPAHDGASNALGSPVVATAGGLERLFEFVVNGGSNRGIFEDPFVFKLFDEFHW